jgi:hypothetical protein
MKEVGVLTTDQARRENQESLKEATNEWCRL